MTETRQYEFQADVPQVLSLVIESLYSNREIFLRELISNASDALDKLRFEAITDSALLEGGGALEVRISADEEARTLTIRDTGVGMTEEELVENLGRIAHSGTRQFLERAREAQQEGNVSLIGQFGVGFYSAFLVAERVAVTSRRAGTQGAVRWSSNSRDGFTIEPGEMEGHGTEIVLHLRADQMEYCDAWRLERLVQQYSDFVPWPIFVGAAKQDEEDEDGASGEIEWKQANRANALWRRSSSEVTDEEYNEFYRHLAPWPGGEPLGRTHFRIEGAQEFHGLLYVPSAAPFDLYRPERRNGVRLYVRRVLILESSEDLVPDWLRFLTGVIDSDDLPLNVSRELLQDSRQMQTIRKQLVKKSLDLFESMASERPEAYLTFWKEFGRVFKEGVHAEFELRNRMAKLLRFESSAGSELTSLAAYRERMPEDQTAIWYALAPNRRTLESSPHLERLRREGREVLYLVDPIDQWVVDSLSEFEGVKLRNAATADLDAEKSDEEKKESEEAATAVAALVDRFRDQLGEKVSDVRTSTRLEESPSCLVTPEGGMAAHIERALRASGAEVPTQKRILEINPSHPIIQHLNAAMSENPGHGDLDDWIHLLHDQALLAEGSPIEDPAAYVKKVNGLLLAATRSSSPSA